MFITTLTPVAKLISRMVDEKESKVKEYMKMMGMTDTSYWISWFIMYFIIYLIITILATLITTPIF